MNSVRRQLRFEHLESRQLLAITTIGASADTYIRDSTPRGSSTVLDTVDWNGAGDWVTYVRFDLSGIDIDTITDASLYLYRVPGTGSGNVVADRFDVYGLTNNAGNTPQTWNEATLSKSNVGAEYSSAAGVNTAQLYNLNAETGANIAEHAPDVMYAALRITGPDLAAFLNERVDDNGLVTFVTIIDAGNVRGWGYASKEYGDATLRPSLMIQHSTVVPKVDPYPTNPVSLSHQMENLDRGLVAVKRSSDVYLSWRMLGTDPANVAFNLYRISNGGRPVKVNATPITTTTDYVDAPSVSQTHQYYVRPIINGVELGPALPDAIPEYATIAASAQAKLYHEIPLQQPAPVNGNAYEANDASVGDLDGDGEYEIVLKWISAEAPIYLDAYKMDGSHLWRIDLGQNVRTGTGGFAATLPYIVYDLDGDGKAEVAMNTAPGTKDAQGNWVLEPGDDPNANYINGSGYPYTGPEYFSVFDGETGTLLVNTNLGPARGSLEDWGDDYGHRATSLKATIAYLDGVRPSVVIGRGIYHGDTSHGISTSKTELTAYNWRDGQLSELWTFTAVEGTNPTDPLDGENVNPTYVGMGNHNLTVGDVDGDGYDEINWGAMVVDHDGTGLFSTGIGHGDALHMSDMDPSNPGLEVFKPNENPSEYADSAAVMYDAMTGEKLVKIPGTGDIGRGVAADIDPNSPGYELWATTGGYIYAADGTPLYPTPSNMFNNFLVWWDADLSRELLDGTTISDWNNPGRSNFDLDPSIGGTQQYAPGSSSNNGTKSTPALSADLWGDWREEVIWRRSDNQALRIFSTPIKATNRLVTLMHDRQYREAIAWQNVGYNQPPHPSFSLGTGVSPLPNVYTVFANPNLPGDFDLDGDVDTTDLGIWQSAYGTTQSHGYLPGDGDNDGDVDGRDYLIWQRNFGQNQAPVVAYLQSSTASEVQSQLDDSAADEAIASLAFLQVTETDELPTLSLADDEFVEAVWSDRETLTLSNCAIKVVDYAAPSKLATATQTDEADSSELARSSFDALIQVTLRYYAT